MPDIVKKPLTVVLVAVLLFSVCFPVPVGMRAIDDMRMKQADAAAPALVAVPVILGTAAALGGVLISGTSNAEYQSNLQGFYDGFSQACVSYGDSWSQYVSAKGSFDNAMNSCLTDSGEISLQTLTDAGFWDSLNTYSAYCVNNGTAIAGTTSAAGNASVSEITYHGYTMPVYVGSRYYYPNSNNAYYALMYGAGNGALIRVGYTNSTGNGYFDFALQSQNNVVKNVYAPSRQSWAYSYDGTTWKNGQSSQTDVIRPDGTKYHNDYYTYVGSFLEDGYMLAFASDLNYRFMAGNTVVATLDNGVLNLVAPDAVSDSVLSNVYQAVVNQAAMADVASLPSVVQPFEPTAAQLEAGYSYADVVDAINTASGDNAAALAGIAAQISSMVSTLAPLSGIAQNVQNIKDAWTSAQASPFSWLTSWWNTLTGWWNSLLAWLGSTPIGQLLQPLVSGVNAVVGWIGSTPFGTVMQTVIDGVQAIPGAVAGAADVVVGGLEGVLEGVLDGVLSIPDALAGVLEGVLSIPDSIAAVLDGLFAAEADMQYEPVSDGLQMRDDLKMQLDAMLDMKAPFCYMRRMQALASNVAGNFGGDASFYFDIDIPFAGSQRFDAGEILNSYWGSMTVAQYIRVMLTATMCAGLLAVSLKIAIGRIGKKE